MKAVIYARFSSDKQNEASIEGQLRECMQYAEYNGMQVIGNYIDRAFSAKTDHRPEFQHMIKDSYKNLFDIVLVWKLDRFSRDRYDSAHYKRILKKNGVRVISATEAISESPEGILLESLLEGCAEYYSAELAVKVRRGMTENALKAKANGVRAPFGYYIDGDDKYQIDETLAPVVKEIYSLYLEGKRVKDIAKLMNARGIKNRGYDMNYNSVFRILTNRKYIGEYKFGDILLPDAIPAIIDKDTFEDVQQRLKNNKKAPAMHRSEDDYLLTTRLFCGKCGAMMVGEIGTSHTQSKYRYYKCNQTGNEREGAEKHACFHGGGTEKIVLRFSAFQVQNTRHAGEGKADESPPCQRQMDVEYFLSESHDLFFRRIHEDEPLADGHGNASEEGEKGNAGVKHQSSPL